MTARGSLLALATMLLLVGDPRLAAAPYPLFDAHIHYSRPDWDAYPPERALALLARAGVRRAIVSSTPDDGTLKLYERAPTVVVPFLRPYRTREDMAGWHADAGVAAYVEERLRRGVYRGIGELHLGAEDVDAPTVRRIAELAKARDLFVQCHIDETTVEKMLTTYPGVKILWAHAGMSSTAATVGRLLDRYPMLWVELALRTDVASDGTLDPEWRALFVRRPDRFMVGTDTWTTSRWEVVRQATARNPLLPLRLFASRNLSASNVIQAIGGVAMFGFFFMGSLDMQRVLGYGPLAIGLAFLPVSIGMGALSIGVTARLIMRFGARNVLLAGFGFISLALVLAARGPVSADYLTDLFPVLALLGIGGGLAFPSLGVVAMAGATPSDAGLASGLLNTTGQVGGALGLAALAAVSTSRTGELIAQGQSPVAALSGGYHMAWAIGAALAIASAVIAATILKSETPVTSAIPVEEELEETCA